MSVGLLVSGLFESSLLSLLLRDFKLDTGLKLRSDCFFCGLFLALRFAGDARGVGQGVLSMDGTVVDSEERQAPTGDSDAPLTMDVRDIGF